MQYKQCYISACMFIYKQLFKKPLLANQQYSYIVNKVVNIISWLVISYWYRELLYTIVREEFTIHMKIVSVKILSSARVADENF